MCVDCVWLMAGCWLGDASYLMQRPILLGHWWTISFEQNQGQVTVMGLDGHCYPQSSRAFPKVPLSMGLTPFVI